MFSLDDPVFAAAKRQADAEQRAEEAEFNSPQAARERAESRDEFADVSDGEAVSVARDAFADELTDPVVPAGSDLPRGLEVTEFLDDHTAQVQTATGEPAGIMDSSIPLTTGDGSDTPIDLSLTRDGDSFAPVAARVDVSLPESAEDAVELTGTGIAFSPVAADASDAVQRSDRLIYPSVDTDTDYIVQPTELGAEAFWQLRSVDSPDTLRLRYDLPAGAELVDRSAIGGAVAVAIVKDGQTIGAVKPVSAVDAAGRPVDVSTEVDGHDLVISVDLHNDAVQLPVLVDPITESWTGSELVNCGAQSAGGSWNVTEQVGTDTYRACSSGWLAIGSYNNTRLNQNGSGTNVSYTARGNTYISDITWGNLQIGQANGANAWMGLFNDNCGCWEATQGINGNRSASNLSQTSAHANWNRAVMGLWYWANAWGGQFVGAEWVAMFIKDGQPPDPATITNTSPSTTPNGNDRYFPWSSTTPSMAVSGHDIGLGVHYVSVVKANGEYIWGPYWFTKTGATTDSAATACTGTRANPCPINAATTLKPFKNLTEGDNVGTVVTSDPGGLNGWGTRVHVRYGTSPSIYIEGTPYEDRAEPLVPDLYDITFAAESTETGRSSSGVANAQVLVDGTLVQSTQADPGCTGSSCDIDTDYDLDASSFSGTHSFEVRATDRAGRETVERWTTSFNAIPSAFDAYLSRVSPQASASSDSSPTQNSSSTETRGTGSGCPFFRSADANLLTDETPVAIANGTWRSRSGLGPETTEFFAGADAAYRVTRCDPAGNLVISQLVGPVPIPGDRTILLELGRTLPEGKGYGTAFVDYLEPDSRAFQEAWPEAKAEATSNVLPPTKP